MKVLEDNYKIKNTKISCPYCTSVLLFDQTDMRKYIGDWQRTGIESSTRKIREYIVCPFCKKEITIKEWEEDF